MTRLFRSNDGYIALFTVIIVGAATMAIALTLLLTGTDVQRSALITQQSIQARQLANACAEEALQIIHDNTAYTGTGTLTFETGTCSYTVSSTGTSTRAVTATGTVSSTVRKVTANVTIGASSISVSSWQETS